MRTTLMLVLLLLFAAAAPVAWGQEDPGTEDEQMQADEESEAVADELVDEQAESDAGEAADVMAEPAAEEVVADDATESDEQDASADQEASAEEEEETADSSGDEDPFASEDASAESADSEAQTTGSAELEDAVGDSANADAQIPAPLSDPQPAPAPTPPQPAPAVSSGSDQGTAGSAWPTASFRFTVDLGMGETPFQEVSGLDIEAQIIEYRAGNSPTFSTIKMPGIAKNGNVTMKKGIFAKDNKFFDWYKKIKMNQIERRTVTIKLLDESGAPVMTWTLANAWPTKISGTDLKSDANETAVESIELSHEGLTRDQ